MPRPLPLRARLARALCLSSLLTMPLAACTGSSKASVSPEQAALLSAGWIDEAPLVVAVAVSVEAGPRRMFDVGRHAQNLMLAATAVGLASCPVTMHHQDVVRDVLAMPDDVEAPMVVTLGWPGPSQRSSIGGPRIPLTEYVMRDGWRP